MARLESRDLSADDAAALALRYREQCEEEAASVE